MFDVKLQILALFGANIFLLGYVSGMLTVRIIRGGWVRSDWLSIIALVFSTSGIFCAFQALTR